MAFLPEELSCANEGCGVLELPTDDVGPLVDQKGQVTVRSDPLGETRVHDCLTSRSDCNGLGHLALATLCDPGDFGSETFNMGLFFVESGLSHKHGEVAVLYTVGLELGIGEGCDLLPNEEGCRAQDVATRDVVVFDQLRLRDNLRVPLTEVLFLAIGDSTDIFLVSCTGDTTGNFCATSCCCLSALSFFTSTFTFGAFFAFFWSSLGLLLRFLLWSCRATCGSCRSQSCKIKHLGRMITDSNNLHHGIF